MDSKPQHIGIFICTPKVFLNILVYHIQIFCSQLQSLTFYRSNIKGIYSICPTGKFFNEEGGCLLEGAAMVSVVSFLHNVVCPLLLF